MQKIFSNLFTLFIVNRNKNFLDFEVESRFRNYSVFCLAGMPTMVLFGVYHIIIGQTLLGAIAILSLIGLGIGWVMLYRCINGVQVFRFTTLLYCLLILYMAYIGGEDGSKLLWVYTFPLASFFLLGNYEGTIWCIILFLCCQVFLWNPFDLELPHSYPKEFALRFCLSFFFISVITYTFERFRHLYRTEIESKNRLLQREIEDRKKAVEALRKRETQYRAVFTQAAEGILRIDLEGKILESNPQMETVLQYPNGKLTGLNILSLIHPDDIKLLPLQLHDIAAGKIILVERRLRSASGDYLLFELSASSLEDNTALIICKDITKRKAAEEALAQANEELLRIANIDGLTEIANRRRFDLQLQKEWKRMRREDSPLTLIMGDVDYFKQYNDIYGHQKGDSCLIKIAEILGLTLQRPADLAARFGGEEFVILLPTTSIEGGTNLAEEVRRKVLELRIPHNGSDISPYVTMSFGVGSTQIFANTIPTDLLAIADKALYQAKQNGRNRVEVAPPLVL